jgi:hypothetical protein
MQPRRDIDTLVNLNKDLIRRPTVPSAVGGIISYRK